MFYENTSLSRSDLWIVDPFHLTCKPMVAKPCDDVQRHHHTKVVENMSEIADEMISEVIRVVDR